jgi:hydrophobic/amphiphilic exporter-1 (mainly G- bacteria), HAE1 family
VIGGLAASTLITLVLIPVVYITANNIKEWILVKKEQWLPSGQEALPAPQTT